MIEDSKPRANVARLPKLLQWFDFEPTGSHGVTRNVQWGAEDCHWSGSPQRPPKEEEKTDYCGFFSDFIFMCCVMATANLSNSSLVTSKLPNM